MKEKILLHVLWEASGQDYLRLKQIIDFFGCPEAALNADKKVFWQFFSLQEAYEAFLFRFKKLDPSREADNLWQKDIMITVPGESDFPDLLEKIDAPPFLLYVKGEKLKKHSLNLAIVGTRKASEAGLHNAVSAGKFFSNFGVTVVSGLAFGIDAGAHIGAVSAEKATIAVLASGVDVVTPSSHNRLAKRILEFGGTLVSEYAPGAGVFKNRYLERNRIISGLSQATLIVEAPMRSGALVTANFAANQNRQVFVTPGVFGHLQSKGSNRLIKNGAEPIVEFDEILEFFNLKNKHIRLSDRQKKILSELKKRSLILEDICEATGTIFSEMLSEISELEMNSLIRKNIFMEYELV